MSMWKEKTIADSHKRCEYCVTISVIQMECQYISLSPTLPFKPKHDIDKHRRYAIAEVDGDVTELYHLVVSSYDISHFTRFLAIRQQCILSKSVQPFLYERIHHHPYI